MRGGITGALWYMYPVVYPSATWYAFAFVFGWLCAIESEKHKAKEEIVEIKKRGLVKHILYIIIIILSFMAMCCTTNSSILTVSVPFRIATIMQIFFSLICILGIIKIVQPIMIIEKLQHIKKIGIWLGGISFEIYLFHYLIMVKTVESKIVDGNLISFIINFIVLIIIAALYRRVYLKIRRILKLM